jgi:hypothetical protein
VQASEQYSSGIISSDYNDVYTVTKCKSDQNMEENKCDRNLEIDSVHSNHVEEVHNVPIDVLIRPIPSILDESKVASLMETIMVCNIFSLFYFFRI